MASVRPTFCGMAAALCWLLAARAGAESRDFLARRAPSVPKRMLQQVGDWSPLGGGNRVADDEGAELFQAAGDVEECARICGLVPGCRSFAYCGEQACHLRAGAVGPATPSHFNEFCTTYYNGRDASSGSVTAPPPQDTVSLVVCHKFRSSLAMNEKQRYEGNPDVGLAGEVTFTLCTDGRLTATMDLVNGTTGVLATHIHRCKGGDDPQSRTAVLCSGPPVVNFCGANSVAQASDGTAYTESCSPFDEQGSSSNANMTGVLVAANTANTTVAELVRDIYAYPDKYYFNVHTKGSVRHFQPKDHDGAARGPLVSADDLPHTATTTAPPISGTTEVNECFHMHSLMVTNELQLFSENPDAGAGGYADIMLCTNGTARATMLAYGGRTEIIATHIHLCSGGNSPQTRTAELCEGAPVMNFCGSNKEGLLAVGTDYTQPCTQWDGAGAAVTRDMSGALVAATNRGVTFAQRVRHIVAHPELYYFNIHTVASYNHWFPKHHGACRGPLTLLGQ